jgi:hypothetical protein
MSAKPRSSVAVAPRRRPPRGTSKPKSKPPGPTPVFAGPSRIEAGLQSLHPELVVEGSLLVVGEDVVGERQVLEPLLGLLVPGIQVRVVLAREFAVGLAHLVGRGALREPEDGV